MTRMPQSLSNIVIHVVYSTKHREPWLNSGVRPDLYQYTSGVLRKYDCGLIQIGGVDDHVHILCTLARTMWVAKLVERTKTATTSWLKEREGFENFSWQAGYGAFSVGPSENDPVVRYIQNQENHHRKVSFKDEYRALLEEAKMEYDERYMWD